MRVFERMLIFLSVICRKSVYAPPFLVMFTPLFGNRSPSPREAATRRATTAAIDVAMVALEEETINIDDNDEGGDYDDFNESRFDIDLNMH